MAVHVTQVMMKPIVQALGNHAVKNGLRCGVSSSAAAAAGAAAASSLPLTKPDATEESSSLLTSPLAVPPRLLMGPGPSNTHPRALAAMALPQLGHMHAPFLKIMDEIKAGLQYLLQTNSGYVCAVSGSGHAAMEASIANVTQPGDKVLVGVSGMWGERVAELSRRFGCEVVEMTAPLGSGFSLTELTSAIEREKPKAVFLCQGESSTGVLQPLQGVGEVCRKNDALLIIDTVCSLGGVPFAADAMHVDVMYSGAQKCLSAPPGASPFFMSERAMNALQSRTTPMKTYNMDMKLIGDYWGWFGSRSYHHTAPISNFYSLREALAVTNEEGLEALWSRHQEMHDMLWSGLKDLGLEPFVEKDEFRLQTVNTIKVPENIDWKKVVDFAMEERSLEIAGGLGPTAGKIWRIGIMGYNARPQNIAATLEALKEGLKVAEK